MRVQRLVMPDTGVVSWTVVGGDGLPIEPVDRFLGYLSDVGRSPNTVRAYAHDLRDFFDYLGGVRREWDAVSLEDAGRFVAWLRLPRSARQEADKVVMLASAHPACAEATVQRKLAAVAAFYTHQTRMRPGVHNVLLDGPRRGRSRATSFRPFLHHLDRGRGERPGRAIRVRVPKRRPRSLTKDEVRGVLRACTRLRDRLLVVLLYETGARIGELLGLRHEDIDPARCELAIRERANLNGVRAKSGARVVPISPDAIRLYADYLFEEYGALDSDYVFVVLWSRARGAPLTYNAAYRILRRLAVRSGIDFHAHLFRHTLATDLLRSDVDAAVVRDVLGHASVATTVDTYAHLDSEDIRRWLVDRGILAGRGIES